MISTFMNEDTYFLFKFMRQLFHQGIQIINVFIVVIL